VQTKLRTIWFLSILLAVLPTRSGLGADVRSVWNGSVGQWAEPTNWLHFPALPDADYPDNDLVTYDVEILSGDVSITPPIAPTIKNLLLGGGSLSTSFPLVIQDSLIWTNGSFGGGSVTVSNGMTIAGDGAKYGTPNLKTYGVSSISGTYFTGFANWENYGTLDFENDGTFHGYMVNEGLIRKTGGTGSTVFRDYVEMKRDLEIWSGVLEFRYSARLQGRIHVETNAQLRFRSGSLWPGDSDLIVSGRGLITVSNGLDFLNVGINVLSETDILLDQAGINLGGHWTMQTNTKAAVQSSDLSGVGSFLVNTGCVLTLSNFNLGVRLTNRGTILMQGKPLYPSLYGEGRLANHSVVELADNTEANQGYFDNFGVLQKSSSTGTVNLSSWDFNNHGLVEVTNGTLSLRSGGTNRGEFRTGAGANLEFGYGYPFSERNPTLAEGTVFSGLGTVRSIQKTFPILGNVTNLSRFDLTQSSALWRGIGAPLGNFHNEEGATISLGTGSRVACNLFNRGTMHITPPLEIGSLGGEIQNYGTATLNSGNIIGGPFNNHGSLHTPSGSTIKFQYDFGGSGLNNFGSCTIDGTLTLESSGTNSGVFLLNSNSLLWFASQNYTLNENTLLIGDGSVLHEHNLTVEGNVTNSARTFILSGLLRGSGRLMVSQSDMQWVGGTIEGPGVLEIAPSGQLLPKPSGDYTSERYWRERTINNFGTAIFRGGIITGHDGVLNNHATLIISNGCSFNWDGVGAKPIINNVGALTVEGGGFSIASSFTNAGTFVVRNAGFSSADFVNVGTANVVGSLSGSRVENRSGTLEINGGTSGPLTNNATLEARKVLTVPSLHLSADSIINFDLGGTNAGVDYGRILIAPSYSTTELNGICNIRLVNGFSPELGQRFSLIVGPPFRKLFTRIHGLNIGGGKRLAVRIRSIHYMEESFDLVVEAELPTNPPPLRIRLNENNGYILSFPAGLEGLYIQVNTNLASSSWHTIGVNDGQEFYWTPYTPFFPTNPYYQPQSFFRLFDPDSP
jgi:hypothetical protein